MRKLITIILLLCVGFKMNAQLNLVHNPSFEAHWRCPQYFELVKYANYWTAIEDTNMSSFDTLGFPPYNTGCKPEYCNTCSSYPVVKVPNGENYTHDCRSGDGMMQVQVYYNEFDSTSVFKRDYLQGRLKQQLISGEQYCVTFYLSLTGGSAYAVNKIGAYLDNGVIDTSTNCGLVQDMYTPQVYTNAIIADTLHWTKVQGSFAATGNEQFITIGNFFNADNTDTIRTHFPHATALYNQKYSWHLIDDVSVIKVGTVANTGNDTTIVEGDTIWIGEHVNYVGDSVWHNDNDDYAPVKWYTATGALIDSNHSGLQVHPATTTKYVMELDVCGTLSYDTITVTVQPVGINSVSAESGSVQVWPNPAGDVVHVAGMMTGSSYRLVNAVGVVVNSGVLGKDIDMRGLSSGVYVLEITDGTPALKGGVTRVRIMKL